MKKQLLLFMSFALILGALTGCNSPKTSENSLIPSLADSTTSNSTSIEQPSVNQSPSSEIPSISTTTKEIIGIEIGNYPNKTDYAVGDEFTIDGLTIIVLYSDQSDEEITATLSMIKTMPNMELSGEQIVTILYEGKETTFKIKIVGEKITPTISFTINNGDKFYSDELPSSIDVLVEPSDASYATHYTENDEDIGTDMPKKAGYYAFVCEVFESEKYNATTSWVTFQIIERSNKITPTFSFTYQQGETLKMLENGTHFMENNVPSFEVTANEENVNVNIIYSRDEGNDVHTELDEIPSVAGTYAVRITSVEDETYAKASDFRWYVIDPTPKENQVQVHLVSEEVTFIYDGQSHSPTWHFEDNEGNHIDDVQYTVKYSSESTGYDSEEAPSEPGYYALSIYITDDKYLMTGNSWIVFHIDGSDKEVPLVDFTFENGDTFYYDGTGEPPLIAVLVEPSDIEYITYFEKTVDDQQINLGTAIPTEPGTYSFICETLENNQYKAYRVWRWFKIISPLDA